MTSPSNDHSIDQHSIEHYGFSPSGGHIGKVSKDDTRQWLENLRKNDEAWYKHLEREREYQKRKAQDYLY